MTAAILSIPAGSVPGQDYPAAVLPIAAGPTLRSVLEPLDLAPLAIAVGCACGDCVTWSLPVHADEVLWELPATLAVGLPVLVVLGGDLDAGL